MSRLSPEETRIAIQVVRDLLKSGMTTAAAARLCGVAQQTISRLVTNPPKELQRRTFERLMTLDPDRDWDAAILSEKGRAVLERWRAWVALQIPCPGAEALLRRMPERSRGWLAVERFRKWGVGRGHDPGRVEAAICQAVARLYRREHGMGIEREWGELSVEDKERYLEAAMKCERIVLDRAPELERVREKFPLGTPAAIGRGARRARERDPHMDKERARWVRRWREMIAAYSDKQRRRTSPGGVKEAS